jgi:cation:H+ antiporter
MTDHISWKAVTLDDNRRVTTCRLYEAEVTSPRRQLSVWLTAPPSFLNTIDGGAANLSRSAVSPLVITIALLLGSAVVIYLACEFFVNGVEWMGHKFDVGQKATGTVLAAFGTALPESVVTFAAVVFGHTQAQKAIGIGAALGGPLVLSTIAYAVVGWTLFATKQRLGDSSADKHLARDQGWFLGIFLVKLAVGTIAFAWKPWLGLAFLAAYGVYVWKETREGGAAEEPDIDPLKIAPKYETPPTFLAVLQTVMALLVIYFASRVFVAQIDALGPAVGLRPQLLALLLSPIATELPETLNAVIWIRQGKVRLALANISGAMMIQATVPTAFGLFFTPWILDRSLLIAGGVTAGAIVILLLAFRRGHASRGLLAAMALGYAAFAALLIVFRP